MKTFSVKLPSLYGDHHVIAVRSLLIPLPGVETVYASSAFQIAEVTYDPEQIDEQTITKHLDDAGYLDALDVPVESNIPAYNNDNQPVFLRHTTAYQQTGSIVSFAQSVPYVGRALWPCPGIDPVRPVEQEE